MDTATDRVVVSHYPCPFTILTLSVRCDIYCQTNLVVAIGQLVS